MFYIKIARENYSIEMRPPNRKDPAVLQCILITLSFKKKSILTMGKSQLHALLSPKHSIFALPPPHGGDYLAATTRWSTYLAAPHIERT